MSAALHVLVTRDLSDAADEFERALAALKEARLDHDTDAARYIRTLVLANAIADSYEGIEKAFQKIASDLDGFVPQGADWHAALIVQMESVVGGRTAVISRDLAERLNDLRGFRHIVRHRYGSRLRAELVDAKAADFPEVLRETRLAVDRFFGGEAS